MDHDEFDELDELLTKTRASALASLTAHVDVEHQLEIIRQAWAAGQRDQTDTPSPAAQR